MDTKTPSLHGAYAGIFNIGAAVSTRTIRREGGFIAAHYNSLTAENQMKFEEIHPEENRYDFAAADEIAEFAEKHGMALRGHTLVWHNQTPDWVFEEKDGSPASREKVLERLRDHAGTVMGRYKGRISAWDVVNEAIEDKSGAYLRETKWLETVGEDYLEQAFRIAHEIDPSAQLFYNDYNETDPAKRDKIHRLVRSLLDAGTPVHGIGMQGHWNLYGPPIEEIREAIELYASLGVRLHITELDISAFRFDDRRTDLLAPTNEMEELLTRRYEEIFRLFREYRSAIDSVTFWGAADSGTWLDGFPVRGRLNWPLPFDRELKPKPAFWSILDQARV
ncbi:endo-1,4-beta-xylanase [Saccharibacillus alkalitolerans]|uniref:Beta-xylanase n=1 Tax=Saccharibacillus alkalitolerans TaxID=2705290 RepID=A0ABX0F332_9BACL|nr:endo-1,4-beta-xylanase [Saccharibacillus alkalitolerans]NGZ74773.1 endo-1,4-beta-xylanase [Saccharibacillus alkalitolerans]